MAVNKNVPYSFVCCLISVCRIVSAFSLRNFCVDYTLTSRINYEVFELFGFVITFQHRSYLLKLLSNCRTCIRYSDMYVFLMLQYMILSRYA